MPLPLAFAAAALALIVPDEALAGSFRAAIWHDLQLNAWIGNGNELAAQWYLAGSEDPAPPQLEISGLRCRADSKLQYCEFQLIRHGGPSMYRGEKAPARLNCNALLEFRKSEGAWSVRHIRPGHKGGHSQTTLRCEAESK